MRAIKESRTSASMSNTLVECTMKVHLFSASTTLWNVHNLVFIATRQSHVKVLEE